eukprot:scaffold1532_cov141-Pinguiococcus_pyrenoidosus.AAC.3
MLLGRCCARRWKVIDFESRTKRRPHNGGFCLAVTTCCRSAWALWGGGRWHGGIGRGCGE